MIILSKEESKLISLYRQIKTPLERYYVAEYIRMTANKESGKKFDLPDSMQKMDIVYMAFCSICKDVKKHFPKESQEKQISYLTEVMERDMANAYYGERKASQMLKE